MFGFVLQRKHLHKADFSRVDKFVYSTEMELKSEI